MQNMEMSRFCKRGSSLLSCLSMVCLLSASTVRAEEEVSSAIYWSESEIALNAQVSDEKMTPNPVKINYSADYLARNLSEDEALCLQYALLDDASGAWQTIQVLSNSDGEYSWQCDIGEANCVKIRLVVSNTEVKSLMRFRPQFFLSKLPVRKARSFSASILLKTAFKVWRKKARRSISCMIRSGSRSMVFQFLNLAMF